MVLEDQLASLRGERIYLRTVRGNAGDGLIVQATLELFARLGLDWRMVSGDALEPAARTVVLVGGGNLVPLYTEAAAALGRAAGVAKRVIVLPSTIRGNEGLLAALGANVVVFCRERASFAHVQRHAPGLGGLHLADDLAFSLDWRAILSSPPRFQPLWLARPLRDRLNRRMHPGSPLRLVSAELVARARPPGAVLHCFRTDRERTDAPVPAGNIDLSALFEFGTDDVETVRWSAYRLLDYLNRAQTIRTNRLHVAIAGALLGKAVHFYADAYGKGRDVYEHSMRDRFPNVTWQGAAPAAGPRATTRPPS